MALALALCLPGCGRPAAPRPAAAAAGGDGPEAIAADLWEVTMAAAPLWATRLGDRRFDARLPDLSAAAHDATVQAKQELRQRLLRLGGAPLHGASLTTARVLAAELADDLDAEVCRAHLWDVDQLAGPHLELADLAASQPLDSAGAASAYVARLGGSRRLLEGHAAALRRGLGEGLSAPEPVVRRVLQQLEGMLATPLADTPWVAAVGRARGLDGADLAALRHDVEAVVLHDVWPALQGYRGFLATTYLPQARPSVGLAALPDGAACYAVRVRQHAGARRPPAALHALGEAEVARLDAAMLALAVAAGHRDVAAYRAALAADPQQRGSREQLLARARALVGRAEAALPRAFGTLPHTPLEVRAVEAYREADMPAGFYEPAAEGGGRAAVFYLNTWRPQARPLYALEALTFHEALPGHHLQVALAQALPALPALRRHGGASAFVEGWGLYAELLADELGLYGDPAARFGMLSYQAWRAARLVVDTGLHACGWERGRAVAYLAAHTALPADDIDNEVDRYIAWPGQALAYAAGRLALQALRAEAEAALGSRFDRRAFHDALLSQGAVPLSVLREQMGEWLAAPPGAGAHG